MKNTAFHRLLMIACTTLTLRAEAGDYNMFSMYAVPGAQNESFSSLVGHPGGTFRATFRQIVTPSATTTTSLVRQQVGTYKIGESYTVSNFVWSEWPETTTIFGSDPDPETKIRMRIVPPSYPRITDRGVVGGNWNMYIGHSRQYLESGVTGGSCLEPGYPGERCNFPKSAAVYMQYDITIGRYVPPGYYKIQFSTYRADEVREWTLPSVNDNGLSEVARAGYYASLKTSPIVYDGSVIVETNCNVSSGTADITFGDIPPETNVRTDTKRISLVCRSPVSGVATITGTMPPTSGGSESTDCGPGVACVLDIDSMNQSSKRFRDVTNVTFDVFAHLWIHDRSKMRPGPFTGSGILKIVID